MGETPTVTETADLAPNPATGATHLRSVVVRWAPLAIAIGFFIAFSIAVLSRPEKMIEPDPYAYRASIVALQDGNLTLTQEQYDALSSRLQQTELGGGIAQWRTRSDGMWVSEKNPGYPFLAVGFDAAKAIRLAPLLYGALAALGLWLGGRRWTRRTDDSPGRHRSSDWGGTFAVGAYFSCALAMVMAWRSTMPTFTDASLIACGLGLLVWAALSFERSHRVRTIVGALGFLSIGLAFFVRYTNIVVLAIAALAALWICLRRRWGLGWSTLVWWAIASIPPVVAALAYNAVVFDGPFSTGYRSTDVQFSVGAIPDNLSIMPRRLLQAMPIWVLGVVAIAVLVGVQVAASMAARRNRVTTATGPPDATAVDATVGDGPPSRAAIDRWVGALLISTWGALWLLYAAYEWTVRMGGGAPGGSAGGPAERMGMAQPVYSTVRFYLPALGAIALLVAWLFARLPAAIGLVVLVVLFGFGVHEFVGTTNSQWARMTMGGAGPGMGAGPDAGGGPRTGPGTGPGDGTDGNRGGPPGRVPGERGSGGQPPTGAPPDGAARPN